MFYPLNNLFKAFDGKGLRAYQLRTGQMRLPVRTAKPIELQYKPTGEALPELPQGPVSDTASANVHVQLLPQAPEVGKIYTYYGRKVKCVESDNCDGCIVPCDEIYCSRLFSFDKVPIKIIPVD